MIPSDVVVLTLRDETLGDYRVTAMTGPDQRFVGVRIVEGEGMAGLAIAERRVVVDDRVQQRAVPRDDALGLRRHQRRDARRGAHPRGGRARRDDASSGWTSTSRISALDLEIAPIVAGLRPPWPSPMPGCTRQVADAAVRDSLTGLANRRHLDAVAGAAGRRP